ncbi:MULTISPECIES: hypothetical protein [unclassified Aliiglaciecola]|uniref:hypothetical protein n=1 Tax=unclassified Aliiglaciecola TaxID=2593648 RepID=UPI0026E1DCD9|nr:MULTISPECIES: hypothetical protein [unclassified Aliiglaciecola]
MKNKTIKLSLIISAFIVSLIFSLYIRAEQTSIRVTPLNSTDNDWVYRIKLSSKYNKDNHHESFNS